MKFPAFALSKAPSVGDEKSITPNAALSKISSESETEKKGEPSIGSTTSHLQGDRTSEAAPVKDVAPLEKSNDEPEYEYPRGAKLVIITIALCLSVFCMALVFLPALVILHNQAC